MDFYVCGEVQMLVLGNDSHKPKFPKKKNKRGLKLRNASVKLIIFLYSRGYQERVNLKCTKLYSVIIFVNVKRELLL